MTQISTCTVQRKYGDFCESPSAPDVPFPICAKHAAKLYGHLVVVPQDELAGFLGVQPAPTSPRSHAERVDQTKAIRSVLGGRSAVYAVQFPDGIIKIGCSGDLAARYSAYVADGGQIVGFQFGNFDDEADIHAGLVDHRARGREWYHPSPEVLEVVNAMRDTFDLPHIEAA